MGAVDVLASWTGFDWDDSNTGKIWNRHGVSPAECERVFFNRPLVISDDLEHSQHEERFCALGRTDPDRKLFVVFTIRGQLIRVISAREMSRRERKAYEAHEEEDSKV